MERSSVVKTTILVVDDDPALRYSLHLILDDKYDVIDAADGMQALAVLSARRVDLILLDLLMPGVDGFEVLESQSTTAQRVPLVVLSGLNSACTAATAMRLGAVDYITKPFEAESRLAVLQEALGPRDTLRGDLRVDLPHVVIVGVDVGIYASLRILFRSQCLVEHYPSLSEALRSTHLLAPDILILKSIGSHAVNMVRRAYQRWPRAHLVVIDQHPLEQDGSRGPHIIQMASGRVSLLITEICAHMNAATSKLPIYSPRINTALDYLGDSYAVASVRRLGRAVGAAPSYLSALFR